MLKKKVGNATVEFLKIEGSKLMNCFNAVTAYLAKHAKEGDDTSMHLIAFVSTPEAEPVRTLFYENINVVGYGFLSDKKALNDALDEYGLALDMQIMTGAIEHYLGESFIKVSDLAKSQAKPVATETRKATN